MIFIILIFYIILASCAYMIMPFLIFRNKNKKFKKNKIIIINFINSFLVMLFFIALSILMHGNIENNQSAPAVFYMLINNFVYMKRNCINKDDIDNNVDRYLINTSDNQNKVRNYNFFKKNIFIIVLSFIVVCFLITIVVLSIILIKSNKELNEVRDDYLYYYIKYEGLRNQQASLNSCLNKAKIDRDNLWKANCPTNEPNCSLNSNIVDWIDSRYESDINVCKIKYK